MKAPHENNVLRSHSSSTKRTDQTRSTNVHTRLSSTMVERRRPYAPALGSESPISFTLVQLFEGDTDDLEDTPLHRLNPLDILLLDEELTSCSQD